MNEDDDSYDRQIILIDKNDLYELVRTLVIINLIVTILSKPKELNA